MKRFKTNRKIFFLPEFPHIIIYIYEKNFFFLFSIALIFIRNTPWKTICKADKWSFLASRIRIFALLNRWKPYDFLICTNFSTHKKPSTPQPTAFTRKRSMRRELQKWHLEPWKTSFSSLKTSIFSSKNGENGSQKSGSKFSFYTESRKKNGTKM